MRLLNFINATILSALWAGSLVRAGEPLGGLPWFALPLLATVLAVAAYALVAWLPRRPGLVNPPDRAAFERLAPERRLHVVVIAQQLMVWVALESLLVVGGIAVGFYLQEAAGWGEEAFLIFVLAPSLLLAPVLFYFVGRMQSETKRQLREQEAASAAP